MQNFFTVMGKYLGEILALLLFGLAVLYIVLEGTSMLNFFTVMGNHLNQIFVLLTLVLGVVYISGRIYIKVTDVLDGYTENDHSGLIFVMLAGLWSCLHIFMLPYLFYRGVVMLVHGAFQLTRDAFRPLNNEWPKGSWLGTRGGHNPKWKETSEPVKAKTT